MTETGKIFAQGIFKNNPILVQVLGICSTLAVTNSVKNTLVMSAALVFVLGFSSSAVSLLRNLIPGKVRMISEIMIIASSVIVVDITLKAYMPDVSEQLGPYVGLIITNCIVMGRCEAFALSNGLWASFCDGVAAALGYAGVLCIIALVRELLATGGIWGVNLLGGNWVNWSMMQMAPGAFFILAIMLWIVKGTSAKIGAPSK